MTIEAGPASSVRASPPWPAIAAVAAVLVSLALGVGLGVGLRGVETCAPSSTRPAPSSQPAPAPPPPLPSPPPRVLVVVSGTGAVSPYTTPWAACQPLADCDATDSCWTAGSSDSFMREYFSARGYSVFTAPSSIGVGVVSGDAVWGGFRDCTEPPLPAYLTINNAGDIDFAGSALVSFLLYLKATYGVVELDIVAHSMGGIYSRAALSLLRDRGWPLRVRSLTTIGTPWLGVWGPDMAWSSLGALGLATIADCQGDATCLAILDSFIDLASPYATIWSHVGPWVDTLTPYMREWNAAQAGVLDKIAVHLVGGAYFVAPDPEHANEKVWPFDGLPSLSSVLAVGVPEATLPRASVRLNATFATNVHSVYFSRAFGLPLHQALTFNPDVMAHIHAALEALDS